MTPGPRITPLSAEEFAARADAAEVSGAVPAALDGAGLLNVVATFGHHPELLSALIPLGSALQRSNLPHRDRELIILRVAHHNHCHYEWEHHARIAGTAGITAEELSLLSEPLDPSEHARSDAALLQAVDELAGPGHRISDDTWAHLAARYDTQQLLELLTLAGTYTFLAYVLNSCDTPPEDQLPESDRSPSADHMRRNQ